MTSEEIAKLCGVSRATVSRVINNSPNVKEETRQKILAIIKEKDYVPIASARRLAGIDSNIIGLFVLDINISESTTRVSKSAYFSQLVNLIIDQANNFGFQVLVSIITSEKQLTEIRNLFISRTIFSAIFIGAFNEESQLDDNIILEYPTIIIDRQSKSAEEKPNRLVINLDNFEGAYNATQFLIKSGHTRIGHISGDLRKLSGIERYKGYKKALEDAKLCFDRKLVREGNFLEDSGYQLAYEILEENITAIFCANDVMAISAIKAIKEKGLSVPEDISVIGFDNTAIGNYIMPALTTVDAPLEYIAQTCIESLKYFCKNKHFKEKEIRIKTNLIIRESTKEA
ncbi:MAG TPA: LacI family transcriptional regulator [Clostridium sp.]|uniref:LacI family transcriptional regulator n=2 Tax=Acetivibrio mesophilus TaxID=2487273 RepID=A0A4Q0I355_9FIRM|nr:LacI family transcriptional regulator [Clostridium sp. Bc-iso-3]RXE58656.1 LacI family transcriptional regulator [Acetivibrio mesophilus]HHV30128.1 LacI family transcriptional regulator [Clostridium sp.]